MSRFILHSWLRIESNYVPAEYGILKTIGPAFTVRSDYGRSDCSVYKRRITMQVCECACGTVGIYGVNRLRRKDIRSCGCTRSEAVSRRFTTHGDSDTVEHTAWMSCRHRCYNRKYPKYQHYGGRGIRVCDRWLDPVNGYVNFLADMGRRPPHCTSIERKDVNGHYEPDNCKWATQTEQMNNTRNTIRVTHEGETKGVVEWARLFGICENRFRRYIKKGMSVPQVLAKLGVAVNE